MTEELKTEEEEEPEAVASDTGEDDTSSEGEFQFAEDPVFDIDYKGDCAYEVKVSISEASEKKQAGEMFDELKDEAEIPGFRRGRAPRKLIEKKFAKVVKGEVQAKLVSEAFQKLIKDEDLKAFGLPDVEGLDGGDTRKEGDALEFTLKFEVSPRVEMGKYRGVEIERPVVRIDDKDIDESSEEVRERHAVFEPLGKAGKAKEGDQVTIDFKGTIDGEDFSGGQAENYPYVLGSKRFLPEFEEVLNGSKADAELSCAVTFPDDYFAEDLRGKDAQFNINVNEIKRRSVPKMDDDFAKQAGYEDVADMREKIAATLRESAEGRSNQIAESRALETVIENSSYEIPTTMIERVADDHYESEVRRLMEARIPLAQIEEREQELRDASREAAIRNVKTMITLNEIGDAEGLEVTEEDFEKEAESLSKSIGAEAEMVANYMASEEQRSSYVGRIFRSKAVAVIMEHAKITDTELTRDELDEEAQADTED